MMRPIVDEMDDAIRHEAMKLATAPRDTTFLIVLNTEAGNDWLEWLLRSGSRAGGSLGEQQWRGNVVATTHDRSMPRVTVFTKVKI